MKPISISLIILFTYSHNALSEDILSRTETINVVNKLLFEDEAWFDNRDDYLRKLSNANPSLVESLISKEIKNPEIRERVIEIAFECNLIGMFNKLKEFIEGPQEEMIASLGLKANSIGASQYIFDRWNKAVANTQSFEMLSSSFLKCFVDISIINQFIKIIDQSEDIKRNVIGSILKYQLGIDSDDALYIKNNWNEISSTYLKRSLIFNIKGHELLSKFQCRTSNSIQIKRNLLINDNGSISATGFPEDVQSNNFHLIARVLPYKGLDFKVGIMSEQGVVEIEIYEDKWVHISINNISYGNIKISYDEWAELKFEVFVRNKKTQMERYVVASVNGSKLISNIQFNGKVLDFHARSTKGKFVIGGLDLVIIK